MERKLKITLIIVSSLAVAGGITLGIRQLINNKKNRKLALEKELADIQKLEEINAGLGGQTTTTTTTSNTISPVRNLDKVLNNPFSEIKGVLIYPAKKSNDPVQGHPYAEGFANIRETPEVNNAQGFFIDANIDNLLGKVSAGSSIGTIISEQYDDLTPKMRWFNVKLTTELDGEKNGWVRGDNVTFKPFTKKKKSSFDGAFVEKYDNSYQLGADVFPHSNWMMGYGAYGNDVTSDFEGNLDLDI
jgi:hypothetical protein